MYLLKIGPGEPLEGPFLSHRALFRANLNMVHPLGDIWDQDLVVSNQEILKVSFISQCKFCDIQDEAILTS